ncbi:MAG: ATP-binding protein [Bauldia sp.]
MPTTSAGEADAPRKRRSAAAGTAAGLWSVADALDHLRGFVADLAGFNGKSATLAIEASPVMVTPDLISAAVPALVQLLRNAIAHGIETPMERLMAGKPLSGMLSLTAAPHAGGLRFVVSDDGRGVDPVVAARGPEAFGRGIADAMGRVAPLGGRIAMVSGVSRGAAFTLTLPLPAAGRRAGASGASGRA